MISLKDIWCEGRVVGYTCVTPPQGPILSGISSNLFFIRNQTHPHSCHSLFPPRKLQAETTGQFSGTLSVFIHNLLSPQAIGLECILPRRPSAQQVQPLTKSLTIFMPEDYDYEAERESSNSEQNHACAFYARARITEREPIFTIQL